MKILVFSLIAICLISCKNGVIKEYGDNGKIYSSITYKWGTKNGPYTEYWENGSLKERGNYLNDLLDGHVESFYSNGQLWTRGNYKKGKHLNEPFEIFNENGTISEVGIYVNDNKISKEVYDRNGVLIYINKNYYKTNDSLTNKNTNKTIRNFFEGIGNYDNKLNLNKSGEDSISLYKENEDIIIRIKNKEDVIFGILSFKNPNKELPEIIFDPNSTGSDDKIPNTNFGKIDWNINKTSLILTYDVLTINGNRHLQGLSKIEI